MAIEMSSLDVRCWTPCCLCKVPVSSKRRLKLNGRTSDASEVKSFLGSVFQDVYKTSISSTELCKDDAGLCPKCVTEVRSIKSTQSSLEVRLKNQLCHYVPNVPALNESNSSSSDNVQQSEIPSSTQRMQRKRGHSISNLEDASVASPAKHVALESPECHSNVPSERRQASGVGVSIVTFCDIINYYMNLGFVQT